MQTENQTDLFAGVSFDITAREHIRSMAGWVMTGVVVAILGYILSAADLAIHPAAGAETGNFSMGLSGLEMSVSIVFILVGLVVNYFLYRFAILARRGLNNQDQAKLNAGFHSLKLFFIVTSVICIVTLAAVLLLALIKVFGGETAIW
ncbi:MAG: hypothetical protein ABW019_05150 [Chitinophagaceae bacterium]